MYKERIKLIKVIAYRKDRRRKYWITLWIGKQKYHLSEEEALKLAKELKIVVAFDRISKTLLWRRKI